jgi:hypothetical protein
MKRTAIGFLFCILAFSVVAQDDTASQKPVTAPQRSYFSASLGFLSNSVYNGRKDSVAMSYITPVIGYYNKSGFFIDGSMSYLARAGASRIDLFSIEAGYDFYLGNFDGEVSANKSFYNSSSTNVSSEIAGSVFVSGGYDFVYIKPAIEAGINFGTRSDYLMAFELEHTFYLLKDKLQVTPGFKASGSTQNYYGSYYNRRTARERKKNNGITYEVIASVEDASKFKILEYQFTVPVSYTIKKFTLTLSPAYALPVNPALVTIQLKPVTGGNAITKTAPETIGNTFYFSLGMNYKF